MILSDRDIRRLCVSKEQHAELLKFTGVHHKWIPNENDYQPIIDPFSEAKSGDGTISFGLTHAGYDLRLGIEFLVFKNTYGEVIDPKRFKDPEYQSKVFDNLVSTKPVIIPAQGYVLGRSWEYLRMPKTLSGTCVGKSTLARSGILINTTPLEPGWEGYLTIEISNLNTSPAVIYPMEGIAQLRFEVLSSLPETDYKDKGGKYQNQVGVTPAIVK